MTKPFEGQQQSPILYFFYVCLICYRCGENFAALLGIPSWSFGLIVIYTVCKPG